VVPRYKVGTITIKFIGASATTEQVVRVAMQLPEGGEFDDRTLDRDIRAIYRAGLFKSIAVKHEPVDGTTFELRFELVPNPRRE
jgi:outer membrane protein insertion porin family